MRNASIAVLREIGVDTGGSNVQFAINPEDGRMIVIEMNPRVSVRRRWRPRPPAVSDRQGRGQAGGGLHLDELRTTSPAAPPGVLRALHRLRRHQDPALRVREVPQANDRLTTQMKSVGEVMAIGRSFQESMPKRCTCGWSQRL